MEWNLKSSGEETAVVESSDEVLGFSRLDDVVASCDRPFVLISERELSVLRRGLTKDGWKRSLYLQPASGSCETHIGAGLLSVANQWIDADVVIPGRGGCLQDFYCECGTRLTLPDDVQAAPEYSCPACGKTSSGERYDNAIRHIQHNRLAGAVLSLAIAFGIEKDRAYARKAAEILLEYAKVYPGPHTTATTGGMIRQSMDEAEWIISLAQAYDLIYYARVLNDEQRQFIEQRLLGRVAEGLAAIESKGLWHSWHLSAVGVVGLAVQDVSLLRYALAAFGRQIADELGEDGLWSESVHCNHFSQMAAYVNLAEACCRAGIDIYNYESSSGKSLKAMFNAPLHVRLSIASTSRHERRSV